MKPEVRPRICRQPANRGLNTTQVQDKMQPMAQNIRHLQIKLFLGVCTVSKAKGRGSGSPKDVQVLRKTSGGTAVPECYFFCLSGEPFSRR